MRIFRSDASRFAACWAFVVIHFMFLMFLMLLRGDGRYTEKNANTIGCNAGCTEAHFVEADPWVVSNVLGKNIEVRNF
jgi:hypothetical protein